MALVDVTGNAWSFGRRPIPASMRPELWFRPVRADVGPGGLFSGVEVQASLTAATGAFTVKLEHDFEFQIVQRWVTNPSEPLPQNWVWEYSQWHFTFFPGAGGRIDDLVKNFRVGTIRAALGPPPSDAPAMAWIDLTDVAAGGALVYAPEGAV